MEAGGCVRIAWVDFGASASGKAAGGMESSRGGTGMMRRRCGPCEIFAVPAISVWVLTAQGGEGEARGNDSRAAAVEIGWPVRIFSAVNHNSIEITIPEYATVLFPFPS